MIRFDDSPAIWAKVFEQSPIGIAFIGTDGKWLKVNKKMCEIVEYNEAELCNMQVCDITHPSDMAADTEMIKKIETGDVDGYEMLKRFITKTNKSVWTRMAMWPIYNDNGYVSYYIQHVQPLLNGEKARAEKVGDQIHVRPSLSVGEFIADNWKVFFGFCTMLVSTLVVAGVAYWGAINKLNALEKRYSHQQSVIMEFLRHDTRTKK